MNERCHILTIIMEDRESAFHPVNELLHSYAPHILLMVGYPMRDFGVALIFLIVELPIAEMGSFSGKLGQIKSVKVQVTTLKLEKGEKNEH